MAEGAEYTVNVQGQYTGDLRDLTDSLEQTGVKLSKLETEIHGCPTTLEGSAQEMDMWLDRLDYAKDIGLSGFHVNRKGHVITLNGSTDLIKELVRAYSMSTNVGEVSSIAEEQLKYLGNVSVNPREFYPDSFERLRFTRDTLTYHIEGSDEAREHMYALAFDRINEMFEIVKKKLDQKKKKE